MKKAFAWMMCLALGVCLMVGCGQQESTEPAPQTQEQTTQDNTAATTDTAAPAEQAQPAQDTAAAPAAGDSNVQAATPAQP